MTEPLVCPRCQGTEFDEVDSGPDSWDDDVFWLSDRCRGCGLWRGWTGKWLIDVEDWTDEADAEEFVVPEQGGEGEEDE